MVFHLEAKIARRLEAFARQRKVKPDDLIEAVIQEMLRDIGGDAPPAEPPPEGPGSAKGKVCSLVPRLRRRS